MVTKLLSSGLTSTVQLLPHFHNYHPSSHRSILTSLCPLRSASPITMLSKRVPRPTEKAQAIREDQQHKHTANDGDTTSEHNKRSRLDTSVRLRRPKANTKDEPPHRDSEGMSRPVLCRSYLSRGQGVRARSSSKTERLRSVVMLPEG